MSDHEREENDIPDVPSIRLTPLSEPPTWKKRKRYTRGVVLPNCRKSTGMGAVGTSMRRSSTRTTTHIFEPSVGMTFDSVAEAHSFFNLYSWEKGFRIWYGKSHTNKVNDYRSMQETECGNAVPIMKNFGICGNTAFHIACLQRVIVRAIEQLK